MPQTKEARVKALGEIISRSWSDDAFKASLMADPMSVLKANGMDVDPGVHEMRIVEHREAIQETPGVGYLVIPPRPIEVELSDADLDNVSGGDYGRNDSGTGDCDPYSKGF